MKAEAWAKLDARLREELTRREGDPSRRLPVLITVAGRTAEAAQGSVEEKQRKFSEAAEPLVRELEAGAERVQMYWLNWTLGANVPVERIGAIASREDVLQILLVESRHIAL